MHNPRYIHQHIQSIVEKYGGDVPLSGFLKSYFKKHPILGSRDRRMLSEMAYVWYRASKAFQAGLSFEKKLEAALFLCDTHTHQVIQLLKPEWQGKQDYFLAQKIALLEKEKTGFDLSKLFPHDIAFSAGMVKEDWLHSMFRQPDLFIRYRKDVARFIKLLKEQKIHYRQLEGNCFAFSNGTKLELFLPEDDYVVQDASSQKTGSFFSPKANESWWDCCSGAGGKSILLKDLQPKVKLTATDKRETILHNLRKRFSLYFNNTPETLVLDVSNSQAVGKVLKEKKFDNIICDVPCSGSGTWARTPEQLYFFDPGSVPVFSEMQKAILNNASRYLKDGGRLFYITCSVFKEENENVTATLTGMRIEQQMVINGLDDYADSMFITVFKK